MDRPDMSYTRKGRPNRRPIPEYKASFGEAVDALARPVWIHYVWCPKARRQMGGFDTSLHNPLALHYRQQAEGGQ